MGEENRKIIHVDMDAFFASVEQKDNPELRNKPIAVGGSGERGVVAAASYEARKFGVRSAMPSSIAKRRCPNLIFVKGRHDRYKEISKQIMSVFYEFTDLVEPLSIDEAFLDVTHNKKNLPSASLIAKEIKERIKEVTGLTASAGISVNKFLAKIASDYQKPDGLFVIPPKDVEHFIEQLSIDKFFGVGKVTADKMHQLGIFRGKDLKVRSLAELTRVFGKAGLYYFQIAQGIDNRPVNPNRVRKSVSTEHTFHADLSNKDLIRKDMIATAEDLLRRLKKSGFRGRTLSLKVKYSSFEQVTRSKTILQELNRLDQILNLANELLNQIELKESIRLLGLTVSNQINFSEPQQLTLDF
ncbi:DNA polymerase IV [Labilibaculum euxinus]|uniref:DNA polymerase IV n=1 Tax=Labilibaculum euxinus TaxID=2686357 RepID=A0A7M4D3N9_9BACT|nr:DNA polymerase IV [Labilibaculum euxinus]MUP37268.1 DNA polymerase IV [Labilibaculum euxinus]MVB06473.1 DNA polymerase IV [Labilibaculum euxinus]